MKREVLKLSFTKKLTANRGSLLRRAVLKTVPDGVIASKVCGYPPRGTLGVQYVIRDGVAYIYNYNEPFVLELLKNHLEIGKFYQGSAILKSMEYTVEEFDIKYKDVAYDFESDWIALNSENYDEYRRNERQNKVLENILLIKRVLRNQIVATISRLGFSTDKVVVVKDIFVHEAHVTGIKNKGEFLGFKVSFTTNVLLPKNISIGKFASKGFGNITHMEVA